jgi:geranylgeranyl pyrophosphate synthase
MAFADRIPDYLDRVERTLDRGLPSADADPIRLHEAMRYAVLGGGKRVRPLLVYATAETLGVDAARVDAVAAAVECIHAYSLVHDDLPAMDDDDLRRGRPTCHKQFDEATAILAGDALQVLAIELVARDPAQAGDAATRLAMIELLAAASGSGGMAGGQAIDLAAVGQELTLTELERMHARKTGALIRASVLVAAAAAPALDARRHDALARYGARIGLAFQIHDDVLDESGLTETIGKRSGADRARGKPTFPSVVGLERSRQMARELQQEAVAALAGFGPEADPLRWLSEHLVTRSS